VSRLEGMGAQQICSHLFLDQTGAERTRFLAQHHVVERSPWSGLEEQSLCAIRMRGWQLIRVGIDCKEQALESVGENVMLLGVLLGNHRFNDASKMHLVVHSTGAHKLDYKVRSCHSRPSARKQPSVTSVRARAIGRGRSAREQNPTSAQRSPQFLRDATPEFTAAAQPE